VRSVSHPFSQHTPAARAVTLGLVGLNHTHKFVSNKFDELFTLEWLCHKVSSHVTSGTPFYTEFFVPDSVSYKEILNVDVLRALTARGFAILFK
jgi:hypothetical protein